FLRHEPGAAARLAARKLLLTLADRELPNTSDVEWETSQSTLFRLRPSPFPVPFGAVFALALAGAALLGRSLRREAWLLAPLAIGLTTCVVFFTNARFRLVLALALIPLAAAFLVELPRLVRPSRERRRDAALVFSALVAGLALSYGGWLG